MAAIFWINISSLMTVKAFFRPPGGKCFVVDWERYPTDPSVYQFESESEWSRYLGSDTFGSV